MRTKVKRFPGYRRLSEHYRLRADDFAVNTFLVNSRDKLSRSDRATGYSHCTPGTRISTINWLRVKNWFPHLTFFRKTS